MAICIKFLSLFIIFNLVHCETLKSLFIIHRHGDRATEYNYTTCPSDQNLYHPEKKWPTGIGQLTNTGKQRMFDVGKVLGKKYKDFLKDDLKDVEIRSSGYDRCLESTQLVVNGIFRSKERVASFQSVPVHTMPLYMDSVLYPFSHCVRSEQMVEDFYTNEFGQKFNETHKNLYKYLTEHCGSKVKHINDLYHLYDIFSNEIATNLPLPDWATEDIVDQTFQATVYEFHLLCSTRNIQRLRTGVFLNDVLSKMEKVIKIKDNVPILNDDQEVPKKAYIYSTHDIFLTFLMVGMGIDNTVITPFGSTLILELYETTKPNSSLLDWDSRSSLKIYLYNETDKETMYELKIPDCHNRDKCTVKMFKESIKDLIIDQDQWEKECSLEFETSDKNAKSNITNLVLIVVILALLLINVFISICLNIKRKR